jgi:hypothetical protein
MVERWLAGVDRTNSDATSSTTTNLSWNHPTYTRALAMRRQRATAWVTPLRYIHSILWNSRVHNRVHKSPPLVPILSQVNSVHNLWSYLITIHFNIIPRVCLNLASELFCSGFRTDSLSLSHVCLSHGPYKYRFSNFVESGLRCVKRSNRHVARINTDVL